MDRFKPLVADAIPFSHHKEEQISPEGGPAELQTL